VRKTFFVDAKELRRARIALATDSDAETVRAACTWRPHYP